VLPEAAFCQACGADLARGGPRSAAQAPPARLVVIAQDGSTEREYPFETGQLDVGRAEGDVILAEDAYVCPRHARILWKNGQFWITDLGSVNGIYGRIKALEPLQHGDLVLLGLQVLRFELVNVDEQAQVAAVERGTRLFGSPAAPRYARLVQRTVEGVSRNVFYLSHTRTTIGRENGDIVFTDDPFMSRQHANITRQYDGSFTLADAGSSNGTFLAIRNQRPLNDGDDVRIGQHLFRLKVRG
jgi:pSer/pThr/pTyr-binding forkhead associated (FHA) protein